MTWRTEWTTELKSLEHVLQYLRAELGCQPVPYNEPEGIVTHGYSCSVDNDSSGADASAQLAKHRELHDVIGRLAYLEVQLVRCSLDERNLDD